MDKQIRDKYLTEAMDECWHEFHDETTRGCLCKTCGLDLKCLNLQHADFSTWEGFGKIWEWSQKQEWFPLIQRTYTGNDWIENIHPDRFADAVYCYLAE